MAEGARLCADAARSGTAIAACFYTEAAARKNTGNTCGPSCARRSAHTVLRSIVAPLLSDTKHPQGIFCVCRMPDRAAGAAQEAPARVLVLENVQDPVQHGDDPAHRRSARLCCISRWSALAATCTARKCCAAAWARCSGSAWSGTRRRPRAPKRSAGGGLTSLAAVPDAQAVPITAIPFDAGRWAVWIGNEGNGLTPEAVQACAKRVTIPMRGRAESFNASTAAAIVLWEMMRGAGEGA